MQTDHLSHTRAALSRWALTLVLAGAATGGCDTEDTPGTIDVVVASADGGSANDAAPPFSTATKCEDGKRVVVWQKAPEGVGLTVVVLPGAGACATDAGRTTAR
jgi:hypothetical protein